MKAKETKQSFIDHLTICKKNLTFKKMIWYCNWKTKRLFSFYMKSHETKDRTRVQTYKMVNAPLMVISKMQNV